MATAAADREAVKGKIKALSDEKAVAEADLSAALAYLDTSPVGLHGRLVDDVGFPRDEVDHYAVRRARNTVDCRKRDLRGMTEQLHELILQAFPADAAATAASDAASTNKVPKPKPAGEAPTASPASTAPPAKPAPKAVAPTPTTAAQHTALFTVSSVQPRSPSADAGLKEGDIIVSFGTVNTADVQAVAQCVRAGEGNAIPVSVLRDPPPAQDALHLHTAPAQGTGAQGQPKELVSLTLVPQRWAGNGLLGCVLTANA